MCVAGVSISGTCSYLPSLKFGSRLTESLGAHSCRGQDESKVGIDSYSINHVRAIDRMAVLLKYLYCSFKINVDSSLTMILRFSPPEIGYIGN